MSSIVPDEAVLTKLAEPAPIDTGVRELERNVEKIYQELVTDMLQRVRKKKRYVVTHGWNVPIEVEFGI